MKQNITPKTAQKILSLAYDMMESATENGTDYGDPYEKVAEKLGRLLKSITRDEVILVRKG